MMLNSLSRLDKLWEAVYSFYKQEYERRESLLCIGVHDYDHIYRVWDNVKRIEGNNDKINKVNWELLQAAAILHDIGYLVSTCNDLTVESHVEESILKSEGYLRVLLFTSEEIVAIQNIISGHHSNQYDQLSLEQKILIIADQLDLLGLDGTLREFIRLSSENQNRDELAEAIRKKSSLRFEKLLKFKVCDDLILEKWKQSDSYLEKIINAGSQRIRRKSGD